MELQIHCSLKWQTHLNQYAEGSQNGDRISNAAVGDLVVIMRDRFNSPGSAQFKINSL
jgi:hypothetical protein